MTDKHTFARIRNFDQHIFILDFRVLQFIAISHHASFVLGPLARYFTTHTLASVLACLRRVRFTCDMRVSWSPRNYKPRAKSARIRTAMDYCTLIRQNKLQVCIILGSRASYGTLFLSRPSQSVQFNAAVLKRMVSTF